MNRLSEISNKLHLRAKILQSIRRFFIDHDFLEIETPIRIPAPAPEAYIEAMTAEDWFLHTSPELCMKRVLAAGYPKIFQICKTFRGKERGRRHLPEFTLLEWYAARIDYFDMMKQTEELIRFVCQKIGMKNSISYQKRKIEIALPWPRISVTAAFDKYAEVPMDKALLQDRFDEIVAFQIEPNLGFEKPVFLYDYPSSTAPLAKSTPKNPKIAQRFELYIAGIEICNAFTELTDAEEQRRRFKKEQIKRELSGKKRYPMPEAFLESLKSMPEASGNALGVDRLVMILADAKRIDDVVFFTPEEL